MTWVKKRWQARYGSYRFSPTYLLTLLTLLGLLVFTSLGYWQLQRATYKRHLLDTFTDNLQRSHPPALATVLPYLNQNSHRYHAVSVRGHFDYDHQFLIAHRFYQHQLGYHVITPFYRLGDAKAMFVNRGWIPRQASDRIMPQAPTSAPITLFGLIKPKQKQLLILNPDHEISHTWPRIAQRINLPLFQSLLPGAAHPFLLLLTAPASLGYQHQWQPVTIKPARHIAYAVQWFSFGAILLGIFCFTNLHKDP